MGAFIHCEIGQAYLELIFDAGSNRDYYLRICKSPPYH